MKKQIVIIHGGDSFATYEEYLDFLKNYKIDLNSFSKKGWKSFMAERLGEEYEVVSPRMPNSNNAKYLEWKIWFEKFIPFLRDNVILVGHSMGGVFLAKYLSGEKFPKIIKATFLIAPPYNKDEDNRDLVEFVPPASLEKFELQGGVITIYQSKDDPIVPFGEVLKYKQKLSSASIKIFEDKGHFLEEEFPEIIEDIKSL